MPRTPPSPSAKRKRERARLDAEIDASPEWAAFMRRLDQDMAVYEAFLRYAIAEERAEDKKKRKASPRRSMKRKA